MSKSKNISSARGLANASRHQRSRFLPSALVLALSSALALPGTAMAADWTGATTDWFTPSNWTNPAGIPGAATNVFINDNAPPAILIGAAGLAQTVTVGVDSTGTGNLTIAANGTLSSTTGMAGAGAGSTGFVVVSGLNSKWGNTGNLTVGDMGSGNLTISVNGLVTNQGRGVIGNAASGVGLVKVTGSGSTWDNQAGLTVGENGTGTLTISNSGIVTSVGGATLGNFGTGVGTVTVDSGGSWSNGNTLSVGELGSGTLTIQGGSVQTVSGVVGAQLNSTGSVLVSGAGSLFAIDTQLFIGNSGTGTLKIRNYGAVTAGGMVAISNNLASSGTLAIDTAGTLKSNVGVIGTNSGSVGSASVDGMNSSWAMNSDLVVGDAGTGTLMISNGGAVSNALGIIGNQGGSTGTVTVKGASWTNDTALLVGNLGTGTLTIANGGTVTAPVTVAIANALGSTGTLNIGGAAGAPAVLPGTLIAAGGIVFGDGNGTINFNHTDSSGNYAFTPVIGGNGKIFQLAGNTNLTADSGGVNGFSGAVLVNGGRLAVNGSVAKAALVFVGNGGTLGGNGTVGPTVIDTGGIIAPGNSIGALNINGNIGFAPGSIYQVEANAAGQSDKIIASGTAMLSGGTVEVLALMPGSYAASTAYTILTAGGGITGSFAGVTSDQAFLAPSLSYDLTNAYLTLTRNDTPFGGVGQTPGQTSTGTGAETLGAGNPIYNALVVLSAPQARAAFDQLSGEVHASARSVLLEDSRFVREAALDRLRAFDTGMAAPTAIGAETPGKPADWLSIRDTTFWGRAMGSWGTLEAEGTAATVKRETAGLLIGADRLVGEAGRVGVVGGYSRSTFDINARNSSGTADNYHVGVYGGNRWGDLALRTGLGYTRHDIETNRSVSFPGFSDRLRADYKAATTQIFGELGYRINSGMLSEQVALEPFVNLAHVNVSTKGFTEQGGAAALTSAGGSNGITFSTLGLRASTTVGMAGGADVTARGMLGYRHAFGDTTPNTSLAFAGGAPFAITGAPIAKGAAVVEAGLDFKLTPAATLGVSYGGQFGSGLTDQTAKVNLNVMF